MVKIIPILKRRAKLTGPLGIQGKIKMITNVITIDTKRNTATKWPITNQFRLLTNAKRIRYGSAPTLIKRMIHPQIQLVRLVKWVNPHDLALLIPIKTIGVSNTKISLLKRIVNGNRRGQLNTVAAFMRNFLVNGVIAVIKPAQRCRNTPNFWRRSRYGDVS